MKRKTLGRDKAIRVQRLLGSAGRKTKASLSLSGPIVNATDLVAGKARRSAFVEKAVRSYLRALLRREQSVQDEHDLQLINASAEATNRASDDLLRIQAWPE